MTYNLRPLHLRMANGVAKTKGHTGAGLSPWRTAKKMTRPGEKEQGTVSVVDGKTVWTKTPGQAKRQAAKVLKRNGEWSYPDMGGSKKAKGLPVVSKEVDNSGDCVGGPDFWYKPGNKGLAEPEANCPGGDYRPNMVYRPGTNEWMDMSPATVEWVICDGHRIAKPSQDLRRKARPVGKGATDTQWADQLHIEVTPGPVVKLGQLSLETKRLLGQRARKLPGYEHPVAVVVDHTKDTSYQHGPLHNVPHPDRTCMAWGGWRGQAKAVTYKQGPKLQVKQPLSLEGLAEMAMAEAWETEGAALDMGDLLATYGEHEAYEEEAPVDTTDREGALEWSKQSTKPVSWEACLLWAHGKTLTEVGTVQGVSKATAQSRVERTLARLQSKVHTRH